MSIRICLTFVFISAVVVGCGKTERERNASGAALYMNNCAVCHGSDARGGGGGGIEGLSKTPPDLTRLSARNDGEFPAYDVLAALKGYAGGGQIGRQMSGFAGLQSENRKRVRLSGVRIKTTPPLGALLVYLESVQQP